MFIITDKINNPTDLYKDCLNVKISQQAAAASKAKKNKQTKIPYLNFSRASKTYSSHKSLLSKIPAWEKTDP
jgi:hypothetical protein